MHFFKIHILTYDLTCAKLASTIKTWYLGFQKLQNHHFLELEIAWYLPQSYFISPTILASLPSSSLFPNEAMVYCFYFH